MKTKNTTVTTIELDEKDRECIEVIKKRMREDNPVYRDVPKRAVISWALRKVAGDIEK